MYGLPVDIKPTTAVGSMFAKSALGTDLRVTDIAPEYTHCTTVLEPLPDLH